MPAITINDRVTYSADFTTISPQHAVQAPAACAQFETKASRLMLIMRANTPVTKLNFNKALVNSTSALMPTCAESL